MTMTAAGRVIPLFDSHFHIIDPRFPLVPNQGYLPEPFTVADYRRRTAALGVAGGAVVSGSFQGFDRTYLLDALARLGAGFVGVVQIPASTADDELTALHTAGVRAVRCNLRRGGSEPLERMQRLARRVFGLVGWHLECYVDGRDLPQLERRLAALPRICIDHLGLRREGLATVLRLAERGAHVKASGFGRVDVDVRGALRAVAEVNPGALVFGTDLPSTRAERAFDDRDVDLVVEALGEERARAALHDNAVALYRPEARPAA